MAPVSETPVHGLFRLRPQRWSGRAWLLAGLLASLTGCPSNNTPQYEPPDLFYLFAHYEVGKNPTSITTADFNHDGITDLLTTNIGNNTLSFLQGNGDGSFREAVAMKVCQEPRAVSVRDLDQDGLLDLALACAGSDQIVIYRGQADGKFKELHAYTVNKIPIAVVADDVNRDGQLDLVIALRNDKLKILLGRGHGEFVEGVQYEYGDTPTGLVLSDLNGDSKVDMVVTNGGRMSNAVSIWLGNGDGTFKSPTDYRTGKRPLGVSLADFNRDNIPDLLVINGEMDTFTVFLGRGDATFLPGRESGADAGPNYGIARDFDGDRVVDVAIVNIQSNDLSIVYGIGDGTFHYPPRNYRTKGGPFAIADFSVMTEQSAVPGLIVANNGASSISVFLHRGLKAPAQTAPSRLE